MKLNVNSVLMWIVFLTLPATVYLPEMLPRFDSVDIFAICMIFMGAANHGVGKWNDRVSCPIESH
jgi:hypothetical protein